MSAAATNTIASQKIVRIAADGHSLEFVDLFSSVPDGSTPSGFRENFRLSYQFKDRSLLEEACTVKFRGYKKDEKTLAEIEHLLRFQNKLAVVGDREIGAHVTRQYWHSDEELPLYNEIVSYGVATNRYMAHQALQMQLLDNCISQNGRAVESSDCDTSNLRDIHLAATCVEAVVGAVWADSQDMANSPDIVAGVMRQFNTYFPETKVEEVAMLSYLDWLRRIGVLRSVGSAPEKGFFSSANN